MFNKLKIIFSILFILAVWQFVPNKTHAQPPPVQGYAYTYDAAGNRILKEYTFIVWKKGEQQESKQTVAGNEITVCPNPVHGLLTVKITNISKDEPCSIIIYDLSGKVILQQEKITQENTLDLTRTPNGSYFMRITIGEKFTDWKIIKEE